MVEVGEVDATHHVQGLVVVGIESEVLQKQLAAYDADGVVVETHADAVWDAEEVGVVDIHLAVDVGVSGGTSDGHAAFGIAVEAEDLVWCEAVDERQGGALHVERGVDHALALVPVGASEQSELLFVEHQSGFDGVGVVFLLQIDHFCAEVAHVGSFVGHAGYSHVGGHGDMLILVLQDMVVAVEFAGDAGQVGYHRRQLSQVNVVQADGKVLQHGRVLVLCVDLHTGLVVGDEVYLGLYLLVACQEDVVVLVQVELFIAQGRTVGHQPEAHAVVLHLCCGSDAYAHAPLGIVEAQAGQRPVLVEMAVDEGVEDELRILAVVAHLPLIGQPLAFLYETQADGVDQETVVVERVEVSLAVDAGLGRGGQVEGHLLEVGAHGSQQVGYRVLALALQMEFHYRQQGLDGRLVDDFFMILSHHRVGEDAGLVDQLLVAACGIEFEDEVATLHPGVGRIGIGLQQDTDVAWGVGLAAILHVDVVQPSADVVGRFHVGTDLEAAVHADGEGTPHEPHLEEVGLGEVAADGPLYLAGVEHQVGADAAFEDLVVAVDVYLSPSVGQQRRCRQVVQVPLAVLQPLDDGLGVEPALGRQEVGAVA